MKIFIINLKRSPNRKLNMSSQLSSDLDFSFFEAVDGRNLLQKWIDKTYSQFYCQIRGYLGFVNNGEIAAFASHYSLWEKCIQLNEPIIILEDDVIIQDDFVSGIAKASNMLEKLHYIRLWATEKNSGHVVISEDLYLYTTYPCGALGYMIDPYAAKQFLKYANKWSEPVDCYMDRWDIHGLRAYCINPELVGNSNGDSDIGLRLSPKLKGFTKLMREILRLFPIVRTMRKLIVGYMNPIVKVSDIK